MPALSSKNPQAKEGALKFMGRCLSSATTPIQTAQIKPLSETLATLVEDGYEGARNEAATCLGTLMKMVGERAMNPVLESLDDMRKAKVKEAYEKATVKCKIGAGGPPKAPAAPEALTKKPTAKKSAATKPASMSASVEEETTQQLKNKPAIKGVRLIPSQWIFAESHFSHQRNLQPLFLRLHKPLQPSRNSRRLLEPPSQLKLRQRKLPMCSIHSNTSTHRRTRKPLPLI